jgi:hypothetical protein
MVAKEPGTFSVEEGTDVSGVGNNVYGPLADRQAMREGKEATRIL